MTLTLTLNLVLTLSLTLIPILTLTVILALILDVTLPPPQGLQIDTHPTRLPGGQCPADPDSGVFRALVELRRDYLQSPVCHQVPTITRHR